MTDTFDYGKSLATADRLIKKFGAACLVRRTTSSGDPWAPTQTTTDFATKAARVEFTWKQLQGGDILSTDQRWLVSAGPLTALGIASILPSDSLVVNGVVVGTILNSGPLDPTAALVVMYDCQIRA